MRWGYAVLPVFLFMLAGCQPQNKSTKPQKPDNLAPASALAPEENYSTPEGAQSRRPKQIDYKNPEHSDIVALVKRAKTHYQHNGEIKALDDFMDPSSQFVAGNTYVFVYDYSGKCLAEWGNPTVVGKDMSYWLDAKNNNLFAQASEKARNGGGWVTTAWRSPDNANIRPKDCYVIDLDGKAFLGSGVYR